MKPHYRIFRVGNSRVTAAKVYSRKEAEVEALRLAEQHPGELFEIYLCLGHVSTQPAAVTWLEEPPSPEKEALSKPPFEYRDLVPGERVQIGDEYLRFDGVWRCRQLGIGDPYTPCSQARTRRRFPIPQAPTA